MKRKVIVLVASLLLFQTVIAHAGEFAALKQKMVDARYALWMMLDNGDKRGPDQQKRVKDTADAVSAMLSGMKAPVGREAPFKELSDTWKAFKKTREEVLVPLILAKGKQKEAEQVATGIQNERFTKMMSLCDQLDK